MLFSKDNKDKDDGIDKGAAKQLGLSKVVYGLGMSARDALVAFVAGTIALTPVIVWRHDKGGVIDKLTKMPDKVHSWWKEKLGDKAGPWGKALVVAASIATIISWVAHLPGLVRGPLKVKEAEETFNNEVAANGALYKENRQLTESLKHKDLQLAELQKKRGSFVERTSAPDAPMGNSVSL